MESTHVKIINLILIYCMVVFPAALLQVAENDTTPGPYLDQAPPGEKTPATLVIFLYSM